MPFAKMSILVFAFVVVKIGMPICNDILCSVIFALALVVVIVGFMIIVNTTIVCTVIIMELFAMIFEKWNLLLCQSSE